MAVNHVREWRGYRTERMLKVQMVKFAGPGFTSMSSESRKKARSGLWKPSALASK